MQARARGQRQETARLWPRCVCLCCRLLLEKTHWQSCWFWMLLTTSFQCGSYSCCKGGPPSHSLTQKVSRRTLATRRQQPHLSPLHHHPLLTLKHSSSSSHKPTANTMNALISHTTGLPACAGDRPACHCQDQAADGACTTQQAGHVPGSRHRALAAATSSHGGSCTAAQHSCQCCWW